MKLGEIAERLGADLHGDGTLEIDGVKPIEEAGPAELTFLTNKKYAAKLPLTRAAAALVARDVSLGQLADRLAVVRVDNPALALSQVLGWFYPPYVPPAGVHPTAVIAPSARIGEGASIGPYAVVGDEVVIGRGARIAAHVVIYPQVRIGDRFIAHAGAVVREGTRIGHRVVLQSGAVVGGDGFGYVPLPDGTVVPNPQTGHVVLEDEVEIGANTTVDRATLGATHIGRGTKIDNLVMIAHGCELGQGVLLAAQVGLSGSTKVGAGVQMGGQVGVAGHLTIGDKTRVAAKSGIPNDVPPDSVIGGYPAVDIFSWRRYSALLPRLPDLVRRLRRVERAIGRLVGGQESQEGQKGEDAPKRSA